MYNQKHQTILNEIARIQKYDLCLYLEPDVKWVDDGLRVQVRGKIIPVEVSIGEEWD
ncbi:hypothetical protein [Bacillus sp. JJ1474]|uniref:hypothetical protein n=1 Tax=Bacillus sp. JJ1474 TaxID=3122955 RepID=UPI002FFE010F